MVWKGEEKGEGPIMSSLSRKAKKEASNLLRMRGERRTSTFHFMEIRPF